MKLTPYTGLDSEPLIRYLYTGREYNIETGDYYYRYRMMEAGIGRFTSKDPIPFINRYRYVDSAPLKYIDKYGLVGIGEAVAAAAAAGATAGVLIEEVDPLAAAVSGAFGTALGAGVLAITGNIFAAGYIGGVGAYIMYEAIDNPDSSPVVDNFYSLPVESRHAY